MESPELGEAERAVRLELADAPTSLFDRRYGKRYRQAMHEQGVAGSLTEESGKTRAPSPTEPPGAGALSPGIPANFKKALGADILPRRASLLAQFQSAAAAGFTAVEMEAVSDRSQAEEVFEASQRAGLAIHSVVPGCMWQHPLSSSDPADVRTCVRALRTALENAQLWGAETVLLVPALVDAATSYSDAYIRSQAVIRKELLPIAAEHGIALAIENVWNGFLLGPLEYVRYIDELESPWVRAYLDVGNMMFGHPEHWIRIAGSRIAKVHLKDFRLDLDRRTFAFAQVGDGAIDWAAVRTALIEVGFTGYVNCTGIPRGRVTNWMSRASVASLRNIPGVRPLASMLRSRTETSFLSEVSQRFDGFRDGTLPPPNGRT